MKNIILIFFLTVGFLSLSKAQNKCYLDKIRFAQWKESLSSSLRLSYETDAVRFAELINYLDYSIFDSLCIEIGRIINKQDYHYYILLNHSRGEYSTTEIILRAYNQKNGYEVRYLLLPIEEKKLCLKEYKHKSSLFNIFLRRMRPPKIAGSHMLAISAFSNGDIQTKWFSIDINNNREFEKLIGRTK